LASIAFCLCRREILLRPARDQLEQQLVQLTDHPGVVLTQRPTPVAQDPQYRELLVIDHLAQPGHPGPDQRHRMRVGGVGLASLSGREDPGSRRQLRRHVDDLLAIVEQPQRDVAADAAAALDRPDPVRPPPQVLEHRPVAGHVGAEPAATQHLLVGVHDLDRHRPLVRVHPDHDPSCLLLHAVLPTFDPMWLSSREGTATSS